MRNSIYYFFILILISQSCDKSSVEPELEEFTVAVTVDDDNSFRAYPDQWLLFTNESGDNIGLEKIDNKEKYIFTYQTKPIMVTKIMVEDSGRFSFFTYSKIGDNIRVGRVDEIREKVDWIAYLDFNNGPKNATFSFSTMNQMEVGSFNKEDPVPSTGIIDLGFNKSYDRAIISGPLGANDLGYIEINGIKSGDTLIADPAEFKPFDSGFVVNKDDFSLVNLTETWGYPSSESDDRIGLSSSYSPYINQPELHIKYLNGFDRYKTQIYTNINGQGVYFKSLSKAPLTSVDFLDAALFIKGQVNNFSYQFQGDHQSVHITWLIEPSSEMPVPWGFNISIDNPFIIPVIPYEDLPIRQLDYSTAIINQSSATFDSRIEEKIFLLGLTPNDHRDEFWVQANHGILK